MNAPVVVRREMLTGLLLAGAGASAFSCKAIIVKLAYRYGVDAVTTLMYPTTVLVAGKLLFKTEVTRRQWLALGVSYVGVLVLFGHEVRAGPNVTLGAALVFGSAVSYALYLVGHPEHHCAG